MFRLAVVQRVGALVVAIVLGTTSAWALTAEEEAKLLPSDGTAGDRFGNDLAFDGDTAVIGSHLMDLDSRRAMMLALD